VTGNKVGREKQASASAEIRKVGGEVTIDKDVASLPGALECGASAPLLTAELKSGGEPPHSRSASVSLRNTARIAAPLRCRWMIER
jgi:hypothetical protein